MKQGDRATFTAIGTDKNRAITEYDAFKEECISGEMILRAKVNFIGTFLERLTGSIRPDSVRWH